MIPLWVLGLGGTHSRKIDVEAVALATTMVGLDDGTIIIIISLYNGYIILANAQGIYISRIK